MSEIKSLPPKFDINDVDILKEAINANKSLGELNGLIYALPNYELFLQPLTIREAVASSEIENIRTTTLDILQAEIVENKTKLPSAQKETLNYKDALLVGYKEVKKNKFIATNNIVKIQKVLEPFKSGIRKQMGTIIANGYGEVIHKPPQQENEIRDLLDNLDKYINNHNDKIDPLIKMAIYHYQFESIHPFYDGNGRTGRILMILYLVMVNRLKYPVLFLSDYILKNKLNYYKLLQEVRIKEKWKEWILFILKGVDLQAKETAEKVKQMSDLKLKWKKLLKQKYSQIYSIEMIDYLFSYAFYTQTNIIKFVDISRPTVVKYMELLIKDNLLKEKKVGKERVFYIPEFVNLLSY
jgi:Fic family protein